MKKADGVYDVVVIGQEPRFVFEKVFARMRAQRAKIAPNACA
jgi:hypothetical protein